MVVVADVEGNGQAGLVWLRFADGKAEHSDNIPKPAGLTSQVRHKMVAPSFETASRNVVVLAGERLPAIIKRDGYVLVEGCAGEENRECDSRFPRYF